jgi:hypothetical protein
VTLLEPDVALTDLGLALESALLAAALRRGGSAPALRRRFVLFFSALGLAAALGFLEHGLVADKSGAAEAVIWTATLLALGVAAAAGYAAAARMLVAPPAARRAEAAAALALLGYAWVVLLVDRRFRVAIAFYLPAAVLLAAGFGAALRRTGDRRLRAGLAGIGLTFAAAGVQQARLDLHPGLDHNALYHLVQAVGLALLFRAAAVAPPARSGS